MNSIQNDAEGFKGVWRPIAEADKSMMYDLCISDGQGYSWRETNCRWKRGGTYGKAGWYYVADEGNGPKWCPVKAVDFFNATHFMDVPELPR